jgi:Helix-turn-helix domain
MTRHTAFRFCLDPTADQQVAFARHAGAARFAFNQCLQMVKSGIAQRPTRMTREPTFMTSQQHELTAPEKGGVRNRPRLLDTL